MTRESDSAATETAAISRMSVRNYFALIYNIVHKDITVELRAKETVTAMLVFGLLVIVVFSFAFPLGIQEQRVIGPGLLWVAFTFAGVLGLNHTFSAEQENSTIHGMMLSPMPRSVLYVGKLISNVLFMITAELVILIIFLWFFEIRFTGRWHYLLLTLVLGTVGFASTGTLFSAISAGLRMRVFLLPILQFPIAVPVIIASVEATGALINEEQLIGFFDWINLLLVFNVIFITVSILLFDYILEE
ncbi:heme exporter protein CcmB [candidate division KSB1 bacterium]